MLLYLILVVLTFSYFRMVSVLTFSVLLFLLVLVWFGVVIIATVRVLFRVLFTFAMVGVLLLRWLFRFGFMLNFCYTLRLGGVPQRGPEGTIQAYGLQAYGLPGQPTGSQQAPDQPTGSKPTGSQHNYPYGLPRPRPSHRHLTSIAYGKCV